MLITTELHPSVLSTLTQRELEKAFELAERYNATGVKVHRCGTIEFVFDRPVLKYTLEPQENKFTDCTCEIDLGNRMPEPFLPSVCTFTNEECEEDDTAFD